MNSRSHVPSTLKQVARRDVRMSEASGTFMSAF